MNNTNTCIYRSMIEFIDSYIKDVRSQNELATAILLEKHEYLQQLSYDKESAKEWSDHASKVTTFHQEILDLFYLFKESQAEWMTPEQIFEANLLYLAGKNASGHIVPA